MDSVTKKFVRKNIKLQLELDSYLANHPELYESIPNGAVLVITLKYDKKFSEDSISIVKMHYKPKQPIIRAEKARTTWKLSPLKLSAA